MNMNFRKQTCWAVRYQVDPPPPSSKITTYLRHGISRISKPSFKMSLLAVSKLKRYVHASYHIIKSFRGEQT